LKEGNREEGGESTLLCPRRQQTVKTEKIKKKDASWNLSLK
jgi:hypothetical protein